MVLIPRGRTGLWEGTSGQALDTSRGDETPPHQPGPADLPSPTQVGTRRFSLPTGQGLQTLQTLAPRSEPRTVLKMTPARLPTAHTPAARRTQTAAPDPMHPGLDLTAPTQRCVGRRDEGGSQDPGWGGSRLVAPGSRRPHPGSACKGKRRRT